MFTKVLITFPFWFLSRIYPLGYAATHRDLVSNLQIRIVFGLGSNSNQRNRATLIAICLLDSAIHVA